MGTNSYFIMWTMQCIVVYYHMTNSSYVYLLEILASIVAYGVWIEILGRHKEENLNLTQVSINFSLLVLSTWNLV